jgi:hypothetical protein
LGGISWPHFSRSSTAMAVDDRTGGFGFGASRLVVAPGDGMFDHGVGNHESDVGWNWRELEAQVAAIEEEGVVCFAVGGDELVHDAAVGTDKVVFGALAEAGQHRTWIACAGQRQNGERGRHFEGC